MSSLYFLGGGKGVLTPHKSFFHLWANVLGVWVDTCLATDTCISRNLKMYKQINKQFVLHRSWWDGLEWVVTLGYFPLLSSYETGDNNLMWQGIHLAPDEKGLYTSTISYLILNFFEPKSSQLYFFFSLSYAWCRHNDKLLHVHADENRLN